jgi:hypothetical protein
MTGTKLVNTFLRLVFLLLVVGMCWVTQMLYPMLLLFMIDKVGID